MYKILNTKDRCNIKNKNIKFLETIKDLPKDELLLIAKNSAEIGLNFEYTIEKLTEVINIFLKSVSDGDMVFDEEGKFKGRCITLDSFKYNETLKILKEIL